MKQMTPQSPADDIVILQVLARALERVSAYMDPSPAQALEARAIAIVAARHALRVNDYYRHYLDAPPAVFTMRRKGLT